MKIKKDDNVIVISGKDRGKTGKVVKALPRINKVIVAGVNIVKAFEKPKKKGGKGQIVDKTMPVAVSNVMLVDPKTGGRTRIGYKFEDGKKVRQTKKGGSII